MDDISTDHDAPAEHISPVLDVTSIDLADLAMLDSAALSYAILSVVDNSTEAIAGFGSSIW